MKRVISIVAAAALILGLAATPSMAAAEVSASVDVVSAYVWRGQTFNDGLVLQPSIDVATESGFGINVWGNYDLDDYDGALEGSEFSEIDLTISYGTSFGGLDVGIGLIEYTFPGGGTGTTEAYLSLAYGLPANLTVGVDVYLDFDEVDEYYTVFSIGYAADLTKKLSLEAGVSAAYAGDAYCDDDEAGLYDYTVSASLGYVITDAWSISAYANYVGSLDEDNLADVDDGGPLDTQVYGGVSIGYTF